MNRAQRRAVAAAERRQGLTPEMVHRAAHRPPPLPIVSVNVPERWRTHFDAAINFAGRLDPEELVGCEVFATWEHHGRTFITVIPRKTAVDAFRKSGEDEIADMIAEPAPGGRHRVVLLPPGEDAHAYGFWFGSMAPGGDA